MQRLSQLVEGLSGFFWHRAGHIREVQYRDIRPDDDPYGLWARTVNQYSLPGYTDHFRSGVIPAGMAWAGAPFGGVPAALNYSYLGTYLIAACNASPHFLFDAVGAPGADKNLVARMATNSGTDAGLRADDGTNNNYAEVYLAAAAAGSYQVNFRYVIGGGAPVVANGPIYNSTELVTVRLRWANATPAIYGYPIGEPTNAIVVAGFGTPALAWSPTRVGLVYYNNGGYYAFADWYWSEF